MTTNNNIINVQHLNKRYPGFALENIQLDIPRGAIMGLVGQNGAGKSTLLNAIYGLIPADSGRILFNGKPIAEYGKDYHGQVAFVSENQQFYSDFTVACQTWAANGYLPSCEIAFTR